MKRRSTWMVVAFASLVTASSGAASKDAFVPEPVGLWPGPMHGATPDSLKGATVVDAARLASLIEQERPVLIDVANSPHRPEGRYTGLWKPIHLSIPGAIWLPGAGTGKSAPGFEDAFAARIAAATGGDKDKPIVTFCHPNQWGSWNAAKRLTMLGYKHVYWYPSGGEGWGAGASTKAINEDLQWKAAGFDQSSAGDMPDDARPAPQ